MNESQATVNIPKDVLEPIVRQQVAAGIIAAMGDTTQIVTELPDAEERMLKWFAYSHLPLHLQATSKMFFDLADSVTKTCEPGPERTVALRKLLEAKDAAVRATLNPGG